MEVEITGATLNLKAWDTDHGGISDPLLIDEFTITKDPLPPSPPRNVRISDP